MLLNYYFWEFKPLGFILSFLCFFFFLERYWSDLPLKPQEEQRWWWLSQEILKRRITVKVVEIVTSWGSARFLPIQHIPLVSYLTSPKLYYVNYPGILNFICIIPQHSLKQSKTSTWNTSNTLLMKPHVAWTSFIYTKGSRSPHGLLIFSPTANNSPLDTFKEKKNSFMEAYLAYNKLHLI